jgi:septation ring formation regulator EzrA
MSDIASPPEELTMPAEYETLFTQMLEEIHTLNEKMRRDQIEIDRLKAESDAYREKAKRLESEHEQLQTNTRAALDRARVAYEQLKVTR